MRDCLVRLRVPRFGRSDDGSKVHTIVRDRAWRRVHDRVHGQRLVLVPRLRRQYGRLAGCLVRIVVLRRRSGKVLTDERVRQSGVLEGDEVDKCSSALKAIRLVSIIVSRSHFAEVWQSTDSGAGR